MVKKLRFMSRLNYWRIDSIHHKLHGKSPKEEIFEKRFHFYSNENKIYEKIKLTEKEFEVFQFLLKLNEYLKTGLTFRVAGGWVRDKMIGKHSNDIDITLDKMTGKEFIEKVIKVEGIENKITFLSSETEQNNHIGACKVKVFGQEVDFVNLRTEKYSKNSRIPIETVRFLELNLEIMFTRSRCIKKRLYNEFFIL